MTKTEMQNLTIAGLREGLQIAEETIESLQQWVDRASALLPLIPRDAGTDLAREVSELLSMHPPRRKGDV